MIFAFLACLLMPSDPGPEPSPTVIQSDAIGLAAPMPYWATEPGTVQREVADEDAEEAVEVGGLTSRPIDEVDRDGGASPWDGPPPLAHSIAWDRCRSPRSPPAP
jgi:hypothetical protein